jgi:hypothetical protein
MMRNFLCARSPFQKDFLFVLKEIKGTSGSGKIFLFLIFYGKGKQE